MDESPPEGRAARGRRTLKGKEFDALYSRLCKVTEHVGQPGYKIELRRMKGTEFFVNQLHRTVYVRFPGMSGWFDFLAIETQGTAKVAQSQILSTLSEEEQDEIRKYLKRRNGAAK